MCKRINVLISYQGSWILCDDVFMISEMFSELKILHVSSQYDKWKKGSLNFTTLLYVFLITDR